MDNEYERSKPVFEGPSCGDASSPQMNLFGDKEQGPSSSFIKELREAQQAAAAQNTSANIGYYSPWSYGCPNCDRCPNCGRVKNRTPYWYSDFQNYRYTCNTRNVQG